MTDQDKTAAREHAHECFPYNASGDASRHEVLLKNAADSFLAGCAHTQKNITEQETEIKTLQFQVMELMAFVSWLKGFERNALHWNVWMRLDELLKTLADSGGENGK